MVSEICGPDPLKFFPHREIALGNFGLLKKEEKTMQDTIYSLLTDHQDYGFQQIAFDSQDILSNIVVQENQYDFSLVLL